MIKYIDTLNIIKRALELKILQYEEDKNHVLLYHQKSEKYPEGWYSNSLDYAAKSLMHNEIAYKTLEEKIQDKESLIDKINEYKVNNNYNNTKINNDKEIR